MLQFIFTSDFTCNASGKHLSLFPMEIFAFFFCLKSLCQNTMPSQTSLFKLIVNFPFSSNVALCFLNFYIHSYAHISQETLCVAGRVADPKCRHASRTEIGNRFSAGFAEHNNIRRLTGIK